MKQKLPQLFKHNKSASNGTISVSATATDLNDNEFGPLTSKEYLYHCPPSHAELDIDEKCEPQYYILVCTYLSYLILIILGHIEDFFGKRLYPTKYRHLTEFDGYAPLNSGFDNFYIRRLKRRLDTAFSRPTTGVPGRYIRVLERRSINDNESFEFTGETRDCLNLSSYNYLGFAQSQGHCADAVEQAIKTHGITTSAPRSMYGSSVLHDETEKLVARYFNRESALVFSMGFATNAALFMPLAQKGCLIISDELNHSSIRFGTRLTGAVIKIFKHNDMQELEAVLREQISQGQPRTHRPWRKIFVAVEGLYSMEGTMCDLPRLIELRRRYKFYLFVDEAHSVGAIGSHSGGVTDFFNIPTNEIDILMGTFTKSFGASGGYVCGDASLINYLKLTNSNYVYGEPVAPAVLTQISVSLKIMLNEIAPGQGSERLERLGFNSRYLRLGLRRLGFIECGHQDSPILPVMIYLPSRLLMVSKLILERYNIAVVLAGYPATPLSEARVRLCMSAALTKEDLDYLLRAIDKVGDELDLKYCYGRTPETSWNIDNVFDTLVEDCKKDEFFK
ncbi:hypothetical protein CANCADRAFT_112307 [Tortispora caseinolytica NRRL Y-17796]|uniref:serine C-palmitoyltransferase n=1 Tax=Tortispora caseinolytica NRRL Y-17796 TaxID=767744 RepID=A0A1E4TGF4_9ASCO|nr:hypothetical protein CANCADRAFT_112307 [Tortispora caseinolytica NRRL Y-17796]